MKITEVRGYVSKPQAKTSAGGRAFSTFTLGVPQKKKVNGEWVKIENGNAWFDVTDFTNSSPPPDKAYVTLSGRMEVAYSEKDGKRFTNLRLIADTVEVAPPRDAHPTDAAGPATQKDPWET